MVGSNWLSCGFIWENAKAHFMETVEDFVLKIGRYSHFDEYMKFC